MSSVSVSVSERTGGGGSVRRLTSVPSAPTVVRIRAIAKHMFERHAVRTDAEAVGCVVTAGRIVADDGLSSVWVRVWVRPGQVLRVTPG